MHSLMNLNFFKIKNIYGSVVKKPFQINGILLGKEKNTVRVAIGNCRIVEAVLKDKIQERIGDKVSIDKSKIISMRIYDQLENAKPIKQDKYEEMLKFYGVDLTEQSLEAVKALEKFNIPASKESIESLMVSRRYFDVIKEQLNHDMAIKLMEKNVDIEHESLQKVANAIEEIREEKESASPWNFFSRNKEITTEEAEKIAKKVYGSPMGKDITDIIKALHKEGVSINKKNIERVYDIFYKLGKLDRMQDEYFADVYKQEIEPTIENLYNVKYHVKEGMIPSKSQLSRLATNIYEDHSLKSGKVSDKTLEMIKDKISDHLKALGLEITKEHIELAKVLIKAGISLTKENINAVLNMKDALKDLTKELDVQKACKMIRDGFNIEKQDIRRVIKVLNIFYKQDSGINAIRIEDMSFSEKIMNLSKKTFDKGINRIANINQMLSKVKALNFQQITFHMTKGIPLNLRQISNTYDHLMNNNASNKMFQLEEQKIINYLKANEEDLRLKEIPKGVALDAGKALVSSGLQISIVNIQKVFEIYGRYSRIRKNLSPKIIIDSVKEEKDLENMELEKLDAYVKEKMAEQGENESDFDDNHKMKNIKKMVENICEAGKEKDTIFPLLLKNNMLFSLKEIEGIYLYLKNQQQLGNKIGEMVQLIGKVDNPKLREALLKLKKLSKKISEKLKEGELTGDTSYDELLKHIGNMQKDMTFSEDETFKEHMKELLDSLEMQRKLNHKNLTVQFPVLLGEQFKNLQVYIQESSIFKKGASENLRTVFMNLDTNHIGQINMMLGIEKNQVDLTIGVNGYEERDKLIKKLPFLEEMLKDMGYVLKKVSFDLEASNQRIKEKVHESEQNYFIFDLKI
ncbi:flagellar hook-length control protein FliK [Crassaminicella thermophila]|uniref:Flagellar hook-length control protein FliK n=1 Tax=Crassaminicella thermophila TaxID=2599308 RepID=A0A5C0S9I5_CRATE|nr:DUF6240 domain-containing protein [Crassaminicella thermophila]QEK11325.1 flagellar hook-length control protein FliK [Crassaminicella thermophila]